MDETPRGPKPKHWIQFPLGYLLAGVTAAGITLAFMGGYQYFKAKTSSEAARTETVFDNPIHAEAPKGTAALLQASAGFRAVSKMLGPAVVNIKATRTVGSERPGRGAPEGYPDPFREFFERFGQPFPFQDQGPRTQESAGSGFIIDKAGHVVTNNHVVAKATKVTVILGERSAATEYKAKIVGTDPKTDLAVLKIEGKNFPVAKWADSDKVEVGDWAVAIGSPFALSHSLTAGVVSAKGRNSRAIGAEYGSLIQTDAAINPGNSGGPLATLSGTVMGVNTAIYTRSGGYMGIGFAIPSNLAKDVVGKLIKSGKVVRGWLGVLIQGASKKLLESLKLEYGVAVHQVVENSPAEAAGIRAGDVVIEVNGKPIREVEQLQRIITRFQPGETVRIKVVSYSNKKTSERKVKIGELPDEGEELTPSASNLDRKPDKLGLIVSSGKQGGVRVERVTDRSPARGYLKVGDVIMVMNRKVIRSLSDYKKVVANNSTFLLEVKRKGQRHKLFMEFSLRE